MKPGKIWLIFELNTGTHRKNRFGDKGFDAVKYSGVLLLFYVDPAFIRHTRVSGRMGIGCLDVWILIFSKLYKYWVGLERSRDHSNKDLRHLITTAYVI